MSSADYFGLEVIDRSDLTICQDPSEPDIPFKLDVCDIHVVFDDPDDRLISVAFSKVSTTDTNGFYQHTFGGDTAPGCNLIPAIPTLVCDSFVTLGEECAVGGSSTDPDFDGTAFNSSGRVSGGWFNSSPATGQGDPDANGRVMIARFSYKQNKTTSGDVCVYAKLAGSEEVTEFLLQPFDCANPGMQPAGPPPPGPTIWFVDETKSATNGCTTWDDACPDLQTALGLADSGDEIWVAQGTYLPSDCTPPCESFDRLETFLLLSGVAIYGGFAGTEDPATFDLDDRDFVTNETILSGDLNGDDLTTGNEENSHHVVTGSFAGSDAILDGFTITAGHANGTGGNLFCFKDPADPSCNEEEDPCTSGPCVSEQSFGGGMMNKGETAAPTITNCTFHDNTASKGGAGMYNGFSSPTITDCTFRSNHSNSGAGALCNNFGSEAVVTNCIFIGNTASSVAGGMANLDGSDTTVTHCIFSGNSAPEGGALYNNSSDPKITDCIFNGNTADLRGGGMINTGSSPTVTNCIFSGNQSTNSASAGGGIQSSGAGSATITNSLFIGNTARNGAGIFSTFPDNPTLTNCTFAANSASNNGGGMFLDTSSATLDNCVFWDNSDSGGMDESAQIFLYGGTPTVTYTDVMDLTQSGPFCELCGDPPGVCCNGQTPNGNIGADPAFVGGASGNWDATATYDPVTFQTTFTHTNANFGAVDGLIDNFLNPDKTQVLQSVIVSNTATTITVWGDFRELGDNMEPYQINDYRLDSASSSPCIDAADNNVVATCGLDLDGNERRVDDLATIDTGNGELPIVDMGAYEFGSVVQSDCNGNALEDGCELDELISPDCNGNGIPDDCDIAAGADDEDGDGIMDECECGTCPTDDNGDGETGAADLAALLARWGPLVFGDCLDANDDLDIGPVDLASLLAAWGTCPQ